MSNITKERLMVRFPYGHFDSSILSRDDIFIIVSGPAYKDMTPRTLKGIGDYPNEKNKLFNYVTDKLLEYFSAPVKDKDSFDKWHKEVCEHIQSILSKVNLKFGKAQKLLNISFKHLYCFKDSDSKEEYFKYCHIPIDNNVKIWNKKNAGIAIPKTAWSNISYSEYHFIEESLYNWLSSKDNVCYRHSNGTPYSLLQLDFIAWISIPKTKKGVIDTWRKFKNTNKLWDKYHDTVVAVFPELKEETSNHLEYVKEDKIMENNKSKKEIIIEWAKEKAEQGEIEFDTAFCNGDNFVRYRTNEMNKLINDNDKGIKIIEGTNPWAYYSYFYEIDLRYPTVLHLQLVLGYKHNPENAKMIYETYLKNYKIDSRKADKYYNWICKFDIGLKDCNSEEELKKRMDKIFYMMKGYETFICYKQDERS